MFRLPFILFKTEKIDRDVRDPAFDKPPSAQRTKYEVDHSILQDRLLSDGSRRNTNVKLKMIFRVSMEIWVIGGSKIGKITIELFNDLVPKTCQLFLNLVRGDAFGHAYKGARIFRFFFYIFIF